MTTPSRPLTNDFHCYAQGLRGAFDLETAAIEERLWATLRMLRKLTREHAVDADDMRALLAAGVLRAATEGD